jgi:hypothetical protein
VLRVSVKVRGCLFSLGKRSYIKLGRLKLRQSFNTSNFYLLLSFYGSH